MFVSTFYLRLLLASCIVLVPAQLLMGSLVNSSIPGTTHEIGGTQSTFTTSADMVGLEIMVYFDDGSTDFGIWSGNGVFQNDWSISIGPNQSTFAFPLSVTNDTGRNITRFALHGAGSRTFFDRDVPIGTNGTGRGRDVQEFFTTLQFSQDIDAVFFDEIQIAGSTPQGDIFAGVDISFSEGISGDDGLFQFRVDTDTSFDLVLSTVPEPTSAIQFGIAIGILALRRRRRMK